MNTNLLQLSSPRRPTDDTCKVSRRTLRERAVELAGFDGRAPQDASISDWKQAKHELTGEPNPQEPEDEPGCWDLAPSGAGSVGPEREAGDEEEDEPARDQRLVEDGINETGHDQTLQASITQSQADE